MAAAPFAATIAAAAAAAGKKMMRTHRIQQQKNTGWKWFEVRTTSDDSVEVPAFASFASGVRARHLPQDTHYASDCKYT